MNCQFKKRSINLALSGIVACAFAPLAVAQDESPEFVFSSQFRLGLQAVDEEGDTDNMEKYRDGLEDTVLVESVEAEGTAGNKYISLSGRDLGQQDQDLDIEAGLYGKFKLEFNWDEQIRNYTDGTFLGTRLSEDYWAVPDATQAALQAGFVPLNANPTAAGEALLLDFLNNAPSVSLVQERDKGRIAGTLNLMRGFDLRAEYWREDRDGLRSNSSGSYRRSATGAVAVGGLGESFRTYGQEFPVPINYQTDRVGFGADFRRDNWFLDFEYDYTKFQNNVGSVTYENPLLLVGQNAQPGGAAVHRMDLAPSYDSNAFSLTGGISRLPLNSRITLTYSNDTVKQDDAFLPFTVNPAVIDDAAVPVVSLGLPQADLNGEVNTELLNVVLNSRPMHPLAVNLRFNRYDYSNDSDAITWLGWVGIGETTWKDYDGSNTAQLPYRNRVPEYERTRTGADATWNFSGFAHLKAEYLYETYDRNADRYADNEEDIYRLTLTLMPTDWSSVQLGYSGQDRDIDGEYAAHLENGVQEEWEELRMFDQAARERDEFDVDVYLDFTDTISTGISYSSYEDTYDEEFYGLHEAKGYFFGLDASVQISERAEVSAYYGHDEVESDQLNRTKSDATGGGAFAIPQNDWATYLSDETDTYGLELTAALVPDKLSLRLVADVSDSTGEVDTQNTNYLAGTTVSGATAYPWPDTEIETTEVVAALEYFYNPQLTFGLRYTYLEQDIEDFAIDNALLYYGLARDSQGNVQSHGIFMGSLPQSYKANIVLLSMSYSF